MRRRRTTVAVIAAIVVGAFGSGARGEEEDPEVTRHPLVFRSEDQPDVVTTVVLDERTGRPIEGAVVRGYAEQTGENAATVNALLCILRTDALGIATARLNTEALVASHWTVTAKGYRPYADFAGYWPPERVELAAATPMAVRVLDAWGRPAAGADVEGFTGCPHAPAVIRGRTDPAGLFRAEDGMPEALNLWVRAEGCETGREDLRPVFGDEADAVVLDPGITVRGSVRDPDGAPLAGAIVRSAGYPRGPATLCDGDGRFTLAGVERGRGLKVFHPVFEPGDHEVHLVERVTEDVPLDLVLGLAGLVRPAGRARLEIRTRDLGGKAATALRLLVIGTDGVASAATTDAEGAVTFHVPPGAYRVRGDDPFAPFEVAEVRTEVPPNGGTVLELAVFARPRLRVEGDVPEDLGAALVVGGAVRGVGDEPVWLPADAPAVLRLSDDGAYVQVVPVGPAVEGVRTAVVRVPPAHRIRLAGAGVDDEGSCRLAPAAFPAARRSLEVRNGVLSIRRSGRFLLPIESQDDGPDRLVALDLPPLATGAVERVIDLAKDGQPDESEGRATLVVTMADGSPVPPMDVSGNRWRTSGARSPVEVSAPDSVLVSPKGPIQPMRVTVSRPGERKVVFPTGGFDLRTVNAAGDPIGASVLIDGVTHDAPEGTLALRGLGAGAHAVVVQRSFPQPVVPNSLVWRFTIAEGEVRPKTLVLP